MVSSSAKVCVCVGGGAWSAAVLRLVGGWGCWGEAAGDVLCWRGPRS